MSKKQKKRSHRKLVTTAIVLAVLAIIFYIIMVFSGRWLVEDDEFSHVKWAVILDGQSADLERNDFTANLLSEGKIDSVLILGRRTLRNRNNAEFYVDDFMQLGDFDSSAIFIAAHDDASTIGEAYTIIPWLKAHKADTVLLVTGAFATSRVKSIFTRLSGDTPVFLTADIHHYQYNPDSWFTHRESRKYWIREWMAYAASYIDLLPAGTLTKADSSYYKPIISLKDMELQKNNVVDLQSLLSKVQEKMDKIPTDTASTKLDTIKTKTVENNYSENKSVEIKPAEKK